MTQWLARMMYPRLDRVRREREVRFLIVAFLLGVLACAAIGGIIYFVGTQQPQGSNF